LLQSAFLWHKQFTSLQVKNSFKQDCWEQFRNELLLSHLAALSASKLSQAFQKPRKTIKQLSAGKEVGNSCKAPTNFLVFINVAVEIFFTLSLPSIV
jgi:hypothetical protein